jgi:antitoxin FitA
MDVRVHLSPERSECKAKYEVDQRGIRQATLVQPQGSRSPAVDILTKNNQNGLTIQELNMPVSIMLKNIPDNVYSILKSNAEANRRSLNSETIVCLETLLLKPEMSINERIASIQRLTSKQDPKKMATIDIDKAKREGRA